MMQILISGASGLLGTALREKFTAHGDRVTILVRREPVGENQIAWDPVGKGIDPAELAGFDAIIHLAGENISDGKWTTEKKRKIRDSRVVGTRVLSEALANQTRPPLCFLSASATGYYGNRGAELLNEESARGEGFLAEVCAEWEGATSPAAEAGIRTLNLRLGVVLSEKGGALAKMLSPFRLGMGATLGDGSQYMSWIGLEDTVSAIMRCMEDETLRGPVNLVSPNPVTNSEFTKTLAGILGRPALLSIPPFALRFLYGELADDALLSSARVLPKKLLDAGFNFQHPQLKGCLTTILRS